MGIVKGEGEVTWINVAADPIPLDGYGVAITYNETSEQKRAKEELRATQKALRAIIDASPLAMVIADEEGIVKLWNPAAEETFGWSEQEALGKILPTLLEDSQDEFFEHLQVLKRKDPFAIWEFNGCARTARGST